MRTLVPLLLGLWALPLEGLAECASSSSLNELNDLVGVAEQAYADVDTDGFTRAVDEVPYRLFCVAQRWAGSRSG